MHIMTVAAMALAAAFATPAIAQDLAPRDECAALEGFDEFRAALAQAVANRDADMLRPLVDPQVHIDFGGGHGVDELIEKLGNDEYQNWQALEEVQKYGCALGYDDRPTMPYYFMQDMPDGFDPYGTSIVLGDDVPMYSSETGDEVVGRASWEAVEEVRFLEIVEASEDAARREVITAQGERGFVDAAKLRSVIDFRLAAKRKDGKWQIVVFVMGD